MRVKLFYLFLIILLVICPEEALNQHIAVKSENFGQENGLSNYANFTHKDSRGIIWVGTQFGLYRFDGQEFVHFDEEDGLPFRQVMEIFEDSEGWFWLHKTCLNKPKCEKDLAFFHPLTQKVLTFEERFGQEVGFQASDITSIIQYENKLYFTADKKICIWSQDSGIIEIPIKGLDHTPVIWSISPKGTFAAFSFPDHKIFHPRKLNELTYFTLSPSGEIIQQIPWTAVPAHGVNLLRFSKYHPTFEQLLARNKLFSWTEEGKLQSEEISSSPRFPHDLLPEAYFDRQIYCHEDQGLQHEGIERNPGKSDLTYVATSPASSEVMVNKESFFTIFVKNANTQKRHHGFELINSYWDIRHYFFDWENHSAWIAGPEGIVRYTYQAQFFQHFKADKVGSTAKLAERIALIGKDSVLFMFQECSALFVEPDFIEKTKKLDKPGIWPKILASDGKGVVHVLTTRGDNSLEEYNFHTGIRKKIKSSTLSDIRRAERMGDHLLVSNPKGYFHYYPELDSVVSLDPQNQFPELREEKLAFVEKAAETSWWIGSSAALYFYDEEQKGLERFSQTSTNKNYLPVSGLLHISKAKKAGFWLASNKGLVRVLPDSGSMLAHWRFELIANLPTAEILSAYEDDYGFAWLGTPHGLIQYEHETGLFKTYLKSDGLSHSSFQEHAHMQTADGRLWLGGYDGFTYFHPKDFKDVSFKPQVPLIILDFEQYKASSDTIENRLEEIISTGEITLEPGDKFFNIRVALGDYREASTHRFAYKIDGYHQNWQEDQSNWIRISGLPYGNYTLKIKGRLQDGQMAEPGLDIPVSVLRPFYKTIGFLLTISLGFILLVLIIFRWRSRRLIIHQKELEQIISERTSKISADKKIIEKQANELRQLDELKSNFFTNVTHELRTPLALILGPVNSMLDNFEATQRNKDMLRMVQRNGNKLLKMVNEILDLSKLEAGKLVLHQEKVAIYTLMRRILAPFMTLGEKNGIEIILDHQTDQKKTILLDVEKFEIILNNLLSNAVKYTPRGGRIWVKVSEQNQSLKIQVKDTGAGIHPDDLPYIFDRFYQANNAEAAVTGGTGIGLALTAEYVKLFQGKIWAQSKPGFTTTFFVEFPIKEVPYAASEQVKKEKPIRQPSIQTYATPSDISPEPAPRGLPKILLVEDNDDLQAYLRLILENEFELLSAGHGEEALELLQQQQPDLIISDIMMPVMDGFQLLEALKETDAFRHIPVIMLTARSDQHDKLKALRIGVDDYLIKPFDATELLVRIKNIVKKNAPHADEIQTFPKPKKQTSQEDLDWLASFEELMSSYIEDASVEVETIVEGLSMSRRQLYRKLKRLTGMTPRQYLLEIRLQHARQLIEGRKHNTIKAVAQASGFTHLSYFSKQYKARFGKLPSKA